MNTRKLVVIGGDAAGMTAASKVRREQPDREIVVFERGNHTSYAACGMPYYIGRQVESEEHLIARKPEIFRQKQNIDVRIRHEVIEIEIDLDLAYAPPFSNVWDPVQIAARKII